MYEELLGIQERLAEICRVLNGNLIDYPDRRLFEIYRAAAQFACEPIPVSLEEATAKAVKLMQMVENTVRRGAANKP